MSDIKDTDRIVHSIVELSDNIKTKMLGLDTPLKEYTTINGVPDKDRINSLSNTILAYILNSYEEYYPYEAMIWKTLIKTMIYVSLYTKLLPQDVEVDFDFLLSVAEVLNNNVYAFLEIATNTANTNSEIAEILDPMTDEISETIEELPDEFYEIFEYAIFSILIEDGKGYFDAVKIDKINRML